jgi:hypothetical protein
MSVALAYSDWYAAMISASTVSAKVAPVRTQPNAGPLSSLVNEFAAYTLYSMSRNEPADDTPLLTFHMGWRLPT